MAKQVVRLSQDADLIIDIPTGVSSSSHLLVVAKAIHQEFSVMTTLSPSTRAGSMSLKIGATVYRIHYELRVKRIINALTIYSEGIRYIEDNLHRYDQCLANAAIKRLRECYDEVLR